MDIETGHMVSEFQTDGMTAKALIPITHNAQSTPQKDFRLLSGAGFLRIDPRIAGGVVQNEVFQWSGATSKFECAATTADGDLVIGSRLGKINLYSRERFAGGGRGVGLGDRKSATTVLPGRGDPILGVDVTKDGSYVVATCQRYLLFYNTHPRGLAENAFKKPAAKAMRPPMKLSIRPTDLKKFGESNFKHAAFNYNGPETTIVASSGKNVITWSVARARRRYNDYTIARMEEEVVGGDFTFNSDDKVVVALPDSVRLNVRTPKKNFRTPTKFRL
eukprot:TRINITY_DN3486_c0_g1_i3.p1 TRINITY_DN3486_c0_g1~~TRINITY_DN3486_c0_g1_i3.p1  ORF type:complete len:276 (+),score=62.27 TRINITY_DN3486_c0_g1_i3:154-981(+)